jgi:quercetin dioxygenase-like cupin family protein
MKVLAQPPVARAERYASALLHDEENGRVVAFHLLPGQRVPSHSSESTVVVHVIAGSGRFQGTDSEAVLSAGDSAVFAPGESHAIDADDETLSFLAVITPRPGG